MLEAIESTETVELTIVQKVMREMGAKGGRVGGKRRLELRILGHSENVQPQEPIAESAVGLLQQFTGQ